MTFESHPSHRWTDQSYHGSLMYECDFCGIGQWKPQAAEPCPRAAECLRQEAEQKEREERAEYARLKAQKERFKELDAKYGEGKR